MKKTFTLFFIFMVLFSVAQAQDIGIQSITAPVSGCTLTAAENVTVVIKNYTGAAANTDFNVSYVINGSAPVTELVTTNIPGNGSVTRTFTAKANLSAPGTYTFNSYTSYPGDINKTDDTLNGYIAICYGPTVGGTVSGGATACSGNNSGTLTLSGQTGNVLNWEYSTDGGSVWTNIANTSAFQNYLNLSTTTMYRAVVKSGSCSSAISSSSTINVNPSPTGGTISGITTVCATSNSGSLSLSGYTGSVARWEYSIDGGSTWTTISNTTTTQNYNNLTVTTTYRSVVQSGGCESYSGTATVTVSPATAGGTISGSATACSGSNSGTLTLSGETGGIVRWEYSTDGGSTWNNISNTTTVQTYLNLTTTTIYRAVVQSGVCPQNNSSFATITIDPSSVGGTISGSATVCSGNNSGTLTLSGQTGNILNWEYSIDGGSSWANIVNTTNSQSYSNLTPPTRLYRAAVKSGVCSQANSSSATISFDSPSVGGTVSGSASVCSSSNSGTVTLSGYSGNILNWEFSTDGGSTWTNISNTTTSQSYLNLTTTTMYCAVIKSGVCSQANSSPATITVSPVTVGGTISGSATVCSGTNSGTLHLNGYTGSVLNWELSTDGGGTWLTISNTTDSQTYVNLNPPTRMYRAVVQSGVCSSVKSSAATIIFNQPSVGGNVSGSATVCSGTNSGVLTLSGQTGNVLNWEFSTDAGNSWNIISNTTSSQNYMNVTAATLYKAIVQNETCAADTSSVAVLAIYPVPTADAGSDNTISLGYGIALNGSGGVNYFWSPAAGLDNSLIVNPVASPNVTTTYILMVTDANGCTGMDSVKISVAPDYNFVITTLITPNGDGKNDTWYIQNIDNYPLCEVSIFNIYSKQLFNASPYKNDWDGTYDGKELPDGSYYFVFKCPDLNKEYKGAITILRNK